MATEYGFRFNSNICTGCKACMMSCNDRNNLSSQQSLRKVFEFGGGSWAAGADAGTVTHEVTVYYGSLACQHCDFPMCIEACQYGALSKDEDTGVVTIDDELCVGCMDCQTSCPYHHPTYDAELDVAKKCILCLDEPNEDGSPNPACAQACPMRALEFGKLDELRAAYGTVNTIGIFGDSTYPNVVITPRSEADLAAEVELLNPNETPGFTGW